MTKNLGLAFQTEIADDVFGGSDAVGTQSQPDHGGGKPSAFEPFGSDRNCAGTHSFSSPRPKFNCRVSQTTIRGLDKTEVRDRCGKVLMRVTDAKLETLHAAGLVEYHGRRHVTHATLRNGVSVASLNATLRAGIRHELPIAEDNRTVRRSFVASGGVYFTPIHEAAWDDGRNLDNRVAAPCSPGDAVRPCTLGERERSGGDVE